MDFSRLPDDVLLEIFKYLPMEYCARLGCVNKAFHRKSQSTISRTTFLDLTNDRFRKLRADQLDVILDLCSANLEEIQFPFRDIRRVQLATTLANYECPRLIIINLADTPINSAVFEQLIRNNSNLATLRWYACFIGFPNVTSNNLKKLYLDHVNDVTLQSMTGRIPNLKAIDLNYTNVTGNVLDAFFASSQQIQNVSLHLVTNYIVFDEILVSFWNLPLISLSIYQINLNGGKVDLHMVATSFPHLQTLKVDRARNYGISSLAALQELEFLHLDISYTSDDEIRALVSCKKLVWLCLESNITETYITAGTLVTLLRGCPQLETVLISNIKEVDTPEEAAVVLGCLSGIGKRYIEIRFDFVDAPMKEWLRSIWESEAAKEAIKNLELNEEIEVFIDWF